MKKSLFICCLVLSFTAATDIVPPPPNFSIAADDTVIDSLGEINDDPQQVVSLTATEIPTVRSNAANVNIKVKEDWKTRLDAAVASTNH